jgi:hypothetical protein
MKFIFDRSKEIYKNEGLMSLVKKGLAFLVRYNVTHYYLYQSALINRNEADFAPKIKGCLLKIVSTKGQLDELVGQGFSFPLNRQRTEHRLDEGAILFLIFVDKELASSGWVATTKKAHASLDRFLIKVDYLHRQAYIGGAWSNPEFRRNGFQTYITYKRYAFLSEKGIIIARCLIEKENIASRKAHEKFAPYEQIYARASILRLLGVTIRREYLLKSKN